MHPPAHPRARSGRTHRPHAGPVTRTGPPPAELRAPSRRPARESRSRGGPGGATEPRPGPAGAAKRGLRSGGGRQRKAGRTAAAPRQRALNTPPPRDKKLGNAHPRREPTPRATSNLRSGARGIGVRASGPAGTNRFVLLPRVCVCVRVVCDTLRVATLRSWHRKPLRCAASALRTPSPAEEAARRRRQENSLSQTLFSWQGSARPGSSSTRSGQSPPKAPPYLQPARGSQHFTHRPAQDLQNPLRSQLLPAPPSPLSAAAASRDSSLPLPPDASPASRTPATARSPNKRSFPPALALLAASLHKAAAAPAGGGGGRGAAGGRRRATGHRLPPAAACRSPTT